MAHSVLKRRIFFSTFIGSKSAWLPSRRSVLIQVGGCVMLRLGQLRSTRLTGGKAWYLVAGFCGMARLLNAKFDGAILRKICRQVLAFHGLIATIVSINSHRLTLWSN